MAMTAFAQSQAAPKSHRIEHDIAERFGAEEVLQDPVAPPKDLESPFVQRRRTLRVHGPKKARGGKEDDISNSRTTCILIHTYLNRTTLSMPKFVERHARLHRPHGVRSRLEAPSASPPSTALPVRQTQGRSGAIAKAFPAAHTAYHDVRVAADQDKQGDLRRESIKAAHKTLARKGQSVCLADGTQPCASWHHASGGGICSMSWDIVDIAA
ncbi:hypothetical protein MY4824_000364 [Beauveria thailandica]